MSKIDDLILNLKNHDPQIAFNSLISLREIVDPKEVEQLIGYMNHPDGFIREHVAHALRDTSSARSAYIAAVNDENVMVRKYAVGALGNIGNDSDVNLLISALGDDDEGVRNNAVSAIGMMILRHPNSVNLEDVQRTLKEFVKRSGDKQSAMGEASEFYSLISDAVRDWKQRMPLDFKPKKPTAFRQERALHVNR